MAIGFKRRLQRLESVLNPSAPKVFLWDDGDTDMKAEIAWARAQPGNENAEITLLRWRRSGEADTAQMEGAQSA